MQVMRSAVVGICLLLGCVSFGQEVNEKQIAAAVTKLEQARARFQSTVLGTSEYQAAAAKLDAATKELEAARAAGRDTVQPAKAKMQAKTELDKLRRELEAADPEITQLFAQVELLKQQSRNAALERQKRAELQKQEAAQQAVADQAKRTSEYAEVMEEKLNGKIARLSQMPEVGDEANPTMIAAKPRDYIGQVFILCGGIRFDTYFNFNYDDAERTHYSFEFIKYSKEMDPDVSRRICLYQNKSLGDDLVKVLATRAETNPNVSCIVRVRATILPHRFHPDSPEMYELLDWQFYSNRAGKWGPWKSESMGQQEGDRQEKSLPRRR